MYFLQYQSLLGRGEIHDLHDFIKKCKRTKIYTYIILHFIGHPSPTHFFFSFVKYVSFCLYFFYCPSHRFFTSIKHIKTHARDTCFFFPIFYPLLTSLIAGLFCASRSKSNLVGFLDTTIPFSSNSATCSVVYPISFNKSSVD